VIILKNIVHHLRGSAVSLISGSVLFGVAVNMFLLPHSIITGGATGIATTAGKLWDFPVGLGIIIINLPIFILCIKNLGLNGMIYSIIGTFLNSVFTDILFFLPSASEDVFVCALIGGAVMGIGSGMLLVSGLTTGGTDLAAYLLHRRIPSLSTGRIIMFFDTAVIILSATVLNNYKGILYSAICTVSYSAALDLVQNASRRARIIFVISDKSELIAKEISEKADRGVTLITGRGYYTGKEKQIIMCVTGKSQEFFLRRLVLDTDPSAFIAISVASGVSGKGFEEII